MVIHGLSEKNNTNKCVQDFCKIHLNLDIIDADIDRNHILGNNKIIAKFSRHNVKQLEQLAQNDFGPIANFAFLVCCKAHAYDFFFYTIVLH